MKKKNSLKRTFISTCNNCKHNQFCRTRKKPLTEKIFECPKFRKEREKIMEINKSTKEQLILERMQRQHAPESAR